VAFGTGLDSGRFAREGRSPRPSFASERLAAGVRPTRTLSPVSRFGSFFYTPASVVRLLPIAVSRRVGTDSSGAFLGLPPLMYAAMPPTQVRS
jgi:hypothetical protein